MSLAEPRTDKEYEARWDAVTLANAERIKADPGRLSSAQSAAKAIAEKQTEDQKAMRKVAGNKSTNISNGIITNGGQGIPNQNRNKSKTGFNLFKRI